MDSTISNSDNQNLVLQSTGVGVDIQDLSLLGDFTLEFRIFLEPNEDINNQDGVVSAGTFGNGSDVNFEEEKLQLYSSNSGGNGVVVQSNTKVETGKWNHYAIVRENGQTQIYLNGRVDGVSNLNWTEDFNISHIAQSLSGGLYGQLDELRIWQVARSEADIQDNMDIDVATDSSGLKRYYRFDDQPAGHIIDATGNAETGHDLHPPFGTSIVNAAEDISAGEFIDTQVANGLFLPTDMAFLPDGRMLVIEKSGIIKIFEDPTVPGSSSQVYMDLSDTVLNVSEKGLLAIEVDPNFKTNGYFYLLYTNSIETKTTVSRFQHIENDGGSSSEGNLAEERVLWQENDIADAAAHQGGGLAIGYEPSGADDPSPYKIFITVGEEFIGSNSVNLRHDDGKVHRINLTDGSIPTDNPYYEAATASNYTPEVDTSSAISSEGIIQTIYSYGLRNPFRASYDQGSNSLFIGEVGGNNNNTAREDIHIAAPGANHGWPKYEGFLPDSENPGNPIHSYPHLNGPGQGEIAFFGANGASVSGGVVYRGDDFPEEYQGAYFYGDWVRNWIRYLEIDYSGDRPVLIEDRFFKNATGQVLSFEEGPDGGLYYLTTFQTGNVNTFQGAINRLDWSDNNFAPSGTGIVISSQEQEGTTTPHLVTFEADVIDPDGDTLSYQWSFGDGIDFDGDGIGDTATSTEANPTYTYNEKGQYTVELIVTDSNGAATVFDSQTVVVGQRPDVNISSPANDYLFRAGETLNFTGSASDPEDGILSGENVVWSAVFLHNEHSHPGISGVPNQVGGITFEIETSGHDYSSNTGYEIFLTATDSDGISSTESVIVRPDKVDITFDAPATDDYTFLLDGLSYDGDFVYDTLIDFEHTISAQETYTEGGFEYNFSHWEDDVSNTNPVRDFIVPETNTTLRPIYTKGDDANSTLSLDGTGGINIESLTLSDDFTVETWVKFTPGTSINNIDAIVSSGSFGNGNDINFASGKARIYSSNYQGYDPVIAKQKAIINQWMHYAIVRENGVAKVYIDGQLDSTATEQWNGDFTIDKIGRGVRNNGLNGELDELRIWSTARTQAEIEASKDLTIDPSATGLERYYSFDGDFIDLTGNSDEVVTLPNRARLIDSTSPVRDSSVNIAPVAVDDTATVTEGSTNHLHILDNDYDPDGSINPQAVEILTAPSYGTLEMMDTHAELEERGKDMHHFGHAEYAPEAGFTGTDSFIYRVQDNQGAWSNPATMTITVEPEATNVAPVAVDDTATVTEGSTNHLHILDNDYDPDGSINPQAVEILTAPNHGTLEMMDTHAELEERGKDMHHFGHAEYTPEAGFTGTDSFIYRVQDNQGAWSNPATMTITVEPKATNVAPVAVDDNSTTDENHPVTINVLTNDSDADGDFLLVLEATASNGTVEINSDRTLTYTPNSGYHGEDWIQYRISDGNGGEDSATVNLTIDRNSTVPSGNNALSLNARGGIGIENITLTDDFTVETWVKLASGKGINHIDAIVSSGNFGNGNDLNFASGKARIYSSNYQFGYDPVIANQKSVSGQWTHYAFVRENGTARVYIDGQLDSTSNNQWNGEFVVDKIGQGVRDRGLYGELDELRIWSTARTQTEIEAGKDIEINESALGLERYYQFNDGIVDLTGNSDEVLLPNHAQLVNSTAPIDSSDLNLNIAPVAADNDVVVLEDSINYIRILDNDSDSDGSLNPLMVEILTEPTHGNVEILDTQAELDARNRSINYFGRAEYSTPEDFSGVDVFTYRVQDNEGAWSNPATVTITVGAQNPVGDHSHHINAIADPFTSHTEEDTILMGSTM